MPFAAQIQRLHADTRHLRTMWDQTATMWRDDGYGRFERTYLAQIEGDLRAICQALEQLESITEAELRNLQQSEALLR